MKLVEPFARAVQGREVRLLGQELGLPAHFVGRHPFPGPASPSAFRAHDITREKLDILRKADAIYLDEIRKAGLYDAIWQAFAVLLPGAHRGRHGRRPHLRPGAGAARRDLHRRHDGGESYPFDHGSSPASAPHHQRGAGCESGGLYVTSKPPGRSSGSEWRRGNTHHRSRAPHCGAGEGDCRSERDGGLAVAEDR